MSAFDSGVRFDAEALGIEELLQEYGGMVRAELQRVIPTGQPAAYLYDLIADYPRRGGKMLRSSLCMATARMLGADIEDALATAVSIELMHNAILIHDDIEDGSEERRGSPTLHAKHGVPLAINAGDALSLLSLRPLRLNVERLGVRKATRIWDETERMAWETTEGQALDLGWSRDNVLDLRDEDYLEMVLKKTCWLTTIHPMRVGAIIAMGSSAPLDGLLRFGFFFGAAFQIQDDLLNLEGGDGYGKERFGDLLEGKRTLMIIHAARNATPANRLRLKRFLGKIRQRRTLREAAWINSLLEDLGAPEYASRIAKGLAGAALYEFDEVLGNAKEGRDKAAVRAMVSWVLRRAH